MPKKWISSGLICGLLLGFTASHAVAVQSPTPTVLASTPPGCKFVDSLSLRFGIELPDIVKEMCGNGRP